ncbi:MAG TPA: hypothetical protein VFM18_22345 [Methanosarcina sp.]|nr:hypothetical protein [Methanosarcina sp.]
MSFTLEEIYGITRQEFCERTGTPMEEMAIRLEKEITMLEVNLAVRRAEFISGGAITDDEQRYRAKLIKAIEAKIKRKKDKVKDIKEQL